MTMALLTAALAFCVLPGVAAAKKKPDRVRVMSYNLYLGSGLTDAEAEITTPTSGPGSDPRLAQFDRFANEVGEVVRETDLNNFNIRAIRIAKDIAKKKVDLVGLQEATLWRVQIPSDGGAPSASNPAATRAGIVEYDYIQRLLQELNKDAKTAKECKQEGIPKSKCYRGYRLVIAQQETDLEFPGDVDNNPGPNGRHGEGPNNPDSPSTGLAPPCYVAMGGAPAVNLGVDDTGLFFGDPGPPAPPGVPNLDYNGDTAACDPTVPSFGLEPGKSDCPDDNPGPALDVFTSTCLFHGIDRDARLTLRDAILARKGAGVKTKNSQSANFSPGSIATVATATGDALGFIRGWTSTDARVRGKSFHFVNTHLESVDDLTPGGITFREAQARELVASGGPATAAPTVLVGDLNSDPASGDPLSPPAFNALVAAGFRSLTGLASTSGHGELLSDASDTLGESRIDHILTNSPKIKSKGSGVIDKYSKGLWSSDHAGVFARLNIKK